MIDPVLEYERFLREFEAFLRAHSKRQAVEVAAAHLV